MQQIINIYLGLQFIFYTIDAVAFAVDCWFFFC